VTLPTEAEWEYACRAGSEGIWPWGDKEEDAQGKANVVGEGEEPGWAVKFKGVRDGNNYTAPGGAFDANAFGLKNMIGNVWEWCSDMPRRYIEIKGTLDDPQGAVHGVSRAIKGGAYCSPVGATRCAYRAFNGPSAAKSDTGFRVVCFLR